MFRHTQGTIHHTSWLNESNVEQFFSLTSGLPLGCCYRLWSGDTAAVHWAPQHHPIPRLCRSTQVCGRKLLHGRGRHVRLSRHSHPRAGWKQSPCHGEFYSILDHTDRSNVILCIVGLCLLAEICSHCCKSSMFSMCSLCLTNFILNCST